MLKARHFNSTKNEIAVKRMQQQKRGQLFSKKLLQEMFNHYFQIHTIIES
jgi:hypothetical protein